MYANRLFVHHAEPGDVEAILAMARELATAVDDPPPMLDRANFLRDGFGADRWFECFIAKHDGEPVGYALACRSFEAHTGQRRLWLGDLYVRPEARRIGAGRALMRAIARYAIALDCAAVYWELWRQNSAGRVFYRKLLAEEADDLAVFRLGAGRLSGLALDAET